MADNSNLLAALGVTRESTSIEIAGHSVKVFQFNVGQVGELMAVIEAALHRATVLTDVVDIINQTTTQRRGYDWTRMATESRELVYHLLAYGLGLSVEEAKQLSAEHLRKLLKAVYEANAGFFGELRETIRDLSNIFPAAAGINLMMDKAAQASGHDTSPSPNEQATA